MENELKKKFLESIQESVPKQTIPYEELEWAENYVSSFKCPHNFNPFECNGKRCDTDTYYDCLEFLKANMLIWKVSSGKVLIYGKKFAVKLK